MVLRPALDVTAVAPWRIGRTIAGAHGCIEWIANHRKDGGVFWNLLFLSPAHEEDGTLLHFSGNQHDITERLPPGMPELTFGQADMPAESAAEFQLLMREIAAATVAAPAHARALERLLSASRRFAKISTRLVPGPIS